ncbi:hypothetical protein BCR34DRAFT_494361, partial [Clohesyomyces aquaticus]
LCNISSFINLTKHYKYVDKVLKKKLGPMHVKIPSFFKAFFSKIIDLKLAAQAVFKRCKAGDYLLYLDKSS